MAEICAFYGIVVKMFFDDHLPAHLHAEYGGHEVLLNIDTLGIIAGKLPARAMAMLVEWASLHCDELKRAWEQTQNLERADKIAPLA